MEVLVALFITAMLAALGSSLLLSAVSGSERLGAVTDKAQGLELAHTTLKADLAQIVHGRGRAPEGRTLPAFAGGELEAEGALLAFARRGWDNPGGAEARGSLLRVEYRLEDDRLVRRTWLRAAPAERTPVVERVLLDGVDRARVSFARGGIWTDSALIGAADDALPELVALELEVAGLGEIRQVFMTGYGP